MRYFDGRFLIYDSEVNFQAHELTPEKLESLGGVSKVKLQIHEDTGLLLPFMISKPLRDPNIHNLNNWFANVIRHSDKLESAKQALAKRLTDAKIQYTEEDLDNLINIPLKAKASSNSNLEEGLFAYTALNYAAEKEVKRRLLVDEVEYKHPNETLKQMKNDDPVGLRLPDAIYIVNHKLGEPYADIKVDETHEALPNRLYRMTHIVNILSASTPEARRRQIDLAIENLRTTYKEEVSPQEERALKSNFKILPLEYVTGNPDNDTVEVLPNEKAFYENLIEFIKYHIHRFNKEVMKDKSEEEVKLKSEEDFNKGQLPKRLVEYLEQILLDVLHSHFYHTGNFNYIVGDLSDFEEEISDSQAENATTTMIVNKRDPRTSDLNHIAAGYLTESSKTFGASVWAEGIVKLMRWGDRKVKNLNVGVNNTQYLDLQSLNLVTQQIADLSQFEVDADEQGRTLDILAVTFCDFRPEGEARTKSYPFLLLGTEYGYLPNVEEAIKVTYTTTLFDIVRDYKNGKPTVIGITFDGTEFKEDQEGFDLLELPLEEIKERKTKIKILDELIEYGVDNNVNKMQGTAYSVIRQEEFQDFLGKEPLMPRLVETPKALRSALVQGALLSIFQEGAQDYETESLVDLLNWYYNEVYPIHEKEYIKVFELQESENKKDSRINAKNLLTSNFFGQGKAVEEKVEEERKQFMYPIYEGPELTFNQIVVSKANTNVIGGYADTPDGYRVFAALDEIPNFSIDGRTVHTGEVLMNMFQTMLTADTESGYTSKTKVISSKSIIGIYKALHEKAK